MSRRWFVVLAVAVLGGGLAIALATGLFDDEGATDTTSAGALATSIDPTTTVPTINATTPATTAASPTTAGEDPLCAAFDEYQEAIDGHLPVEDAEDLELFLTASVGFYSEAVDLVAPPDRGAFAEFLVYQQAQHDFSQGHDWNPSPPLEELLESPPPTAPAAATQTVAAVLEDRCGVEIVRE
jgi:hypothetical protein